MATNTKKIDLVDKEAEMLVRRYHAAKEARKLSEKAEKETKEQMVVALGRYLDEFPEAHLDFSGAIVKPSERPGASIVKANLLLDRGVAPDLVGDCTTRTPYVQYDTEVK